MKIISDPIDRGLLDDWQRDFPVTERPFAVIARALGTDEDDVIERLTRMTRTGRVTRVGATCAPNTVSASTLAAVAAPEKRIDAVASIISAQDGVNHSYQREDAWNIWFVATGPDRAHVNATLATIRVLTGLEVLDLPLVRPFNVDLGFRMTGGMHRPPAPRPVDMSVMRPGDRQLLQQLTSGMPVLARPFAALGRRLGRPEEEVMDRIRILVRGGIITRFGIIVRHRALGWSSNAMVVWDLPAGEVERVGPRLAAVPGVTLCYEREPVPGLWPYRLFNMIHARSRNEALSVLDRARQLPGLRGAAHKVLFSTRCFKQTGALIALRPGAAA